MSDSELEDVLVLNWFDSESDLPKISLINSTLHLGVNVGQTSVNKQHIWALRDKDSNAADSTPNTGTLAGNALLEETGPNTRGCLLGTLIPTPPQSKSTSPFSSHCTKGIGRGRGIRKEGEKNSIVF